MKKWLVGLLAASLCVASAWAAGTASLPVAENYTGTQDWTALTGFSGSGVGSYGDGRCKFDSNNDWLMVQFDGTPGTLTFDIKGNSATSGTAPAKFLVEESADAETWSQLDNLDETKISSSEYTSFSYALASGTRYVRWTFANKYGFNFGLNNIAISSGGPAEFSVTFDKENWFTNVLGQANTITAIPANGIEPYTFLWESDTPELDGGTTDTLQIPDTLAEGDYTVACLVTEDNGEGDAINALIGFHVEAIPVITGGSATYTVVSKTSVEASGDVPTGSTAVYAADSTQIAQISSNKTAVLTLKGYEGMTITGLKLSMKSNKNAGSGSLRVTCGDALLASIEDSSFDTGWSTAFSTNYVDVVPEVTATTIDDDVVITIAGSVNSLYCQSYTVQFEAGEPGLGVTFDKANGFTVDLGTPDSITATAKNGVEPYTYAWTSDTPDLNGTGETLAIPATLAEGDYTVQVEVTDAESNKANKQIYFSVVAPAVKYDVIPTVGGNGVIVASPEQAAEGDDVSLVATANSGYKFVSMTVIGKDSETRYETFTTATATFKMPAEDVYVGATFVEVTGETYTLVESETDFDAGADYLIVARHKDGIYTSALKNETNGTRIALAEVSLNEDNKSITTDSDAIVWTIASGAEDGQYTLYNAAANVYAAAPSSDGNNAQLVSDGTSALAQWTLVWTNLPKVEIHSVSYPARYLQRNSASNTLYFAAYASGQAAPSLYKKAGASVPTVKYTGDTTVTLPDGEFSIQFSLKGYEGEYTWVKDGREGGSIDETTGLYTWKPTEAADEINITVRAVDGETIIASTDVALTVKPEPQSYTVEVADGIINGTVEISVGGEIVASPATVPEGTTVTLFPVPVNRSYKLGSISVKTDGGQDVELDAHYSFTMPSDNVTVYAQFVENVITAYTRISSLDDLAPGKYLLVADGFDQAMSSDLGEASTKRWQAVDVTIATVDDVTTAEFDDDAVVWTLAQDGDNWTLYNEEASKYAAAATSAGNTGAMVDEVTDYARWTISCTDGIFKFASVGQSGRYIQRNNTADYAYFATYTGSAKNIRLFQGEKSGPVAPSVSGTVPSSANIHEEISVIFELKNGTATGWTASLGEIDSTGAWSWTPTEAKAYTLTVTATYDGGSATKDYPIEVVDPSSFDQYTLVTSVDELEDGQYLVVGTKDDTAYAMTAGLSKVLSGTEVTISQDDEVEYILNNDASLVWTVSVDDVTGFMSFYNATDKYIGYDSTKNANELYSFAEASESTSWAPAKDEETGLFQLTCIVHDKDDAVRNLQFNYNSGNVRFSGYKGTQQDVKLFKLGSSSPAISGPSSIEGYVGDELTGTFFVRNLGELTVVDWSADQGEIDDGVWTLADATEGSFTLEVTATLSDDTILTKSVEVTVSQAPVAYTITVNAVGCTVDAPATAYAGDTVNLTVTPAANYELKDITVNGVSQGTTTSFVMPAQDTTVTVTCEALPGVPTLTCTEGTSIAAKVNQELVLHFTLANAEFYTDEGTDGILEDGNDDEDGVFSDFTATSFTWTWTPTATGSYDFHFNAVDGDYEYIVEDYPLTVEVSEGGGEAGEVTFVSMQKVDGVWTFTLSDGTTRTADSEDIWYSTDLVTWIQNTSDTKADLTAPAIYLKVAP